MKNTVLYITAFAIILPLSAQEPPFENRRDSQFYQSLSQDQRKKLALVREKLQGMDSSSKTSALRKLRQFKKSKRSQRAVREKVSSSKKGSE